LCVNPHNIHEMGPKTNKKTIAQNSDSGDEESLMDMMRSMRSELKMLNSKMERVEVIENEVKSLKVLLNDAVTENKKLQAEAKVTERKLCDMDERNNFLENRVNILEQYHRSWSVRALNIPLSADEESDNFAVMKKVYNVLLLPILRGAMEREIIPAIPTCEQLLETAHVLPGKANQPKPVICRFYSRNYKDAILRMKKFYAPREENGGAATAVGRATGGRASEGTRGEESGGFEGRGKYKFPLYEDLSRASFLKMRAIGKDDRVKSCWSIKGQIKFVLHRSPNEVKKVNSLLDHLDDILK
jgi:hypothetical protein